MAEMQYTGPCQSSSFTSRSRTSSTASGDIMSTLFSTSQRGFS